MRTQFVIISHFWNLFLFFLNPCFAETTTELPGLCEIAHEIYTYKAAVVQYSSIPQNGTPEDITTRNTEEYVEIIKSVEPENLDIIVFPEATLVRGGGTKTLELATEVPVLLHGGLEPCTYNQHDFDLSETLRNLSCAAKDVGVYVVVNLVEKAKCNSLKDGPCPESGFWLYNTDVVLDRNGTMILSYRKYNLFGEPEMKKPDIYSTQIFNLDGKGYFGIFTCFDILFKLPTLEIVAIGAHNIIFPTMWFSELPFLTALQTQQMFAQENQVTFLGAGAYNPSVGTGGSGIFVAEDGPLEYKLMSSGNYEILIQIVPRVDVDNPCRNVSVIDYDVDKDATEADNFKLKADDLKNYNSIVLKENVKDVSTEICHGEFCCAVNATITKNETVNTKNKNIYIYQLVAFAGVRSFDGVYYGGVEVCGIVACLDESVTSCGKRFPKYSNVAWPITFEKISITGAFDTTDRNSIQYPSSLLSSIKPISPQYTTWTYTNLKGENKIIRHFTLEKPQNRLLTFAIFGRNFTLDSPTKPEDDNGSITNLPISLFLLIVPLILKFIIM